MVYRICQNIFRRPVNLLFKGLLMYAFIRMQPLKQEFALFIKYGLSNLSKYSPPACQFTIPRPVNLLNYSYCGHE